ncbi:MAG TPA: hypothetical protein VGE67_00670 [Haloferula sp.]
MKFFAKPAFLLRVLAATLLTTSAVRADDEKTVIDTLQPVADAAFKGDYTANLDITYEPMIAEMGGKEKIKATVEVMKQRMAAAGFRMLKHAILKPVRFVKGEKNKYAIVRTLTEMQTPEGLVRSEAFQLGIEVEPGKWQFVDGSQASAAIKKYFADFPADEKLPEIKQDLIPTEK